MRKLLLFLTITTTIFAAKISDVANVVGVRDNHLIGYSLVVGLQKTGDGTTSRFTLQSIANMLKAMNIDMKPIDIKSKNVAAVVVTAELAPFARQGDKLDITVSSIGDAKSLEGGTLLMTPLKGVDGKIYALAQGSMSIGGRNTKGVEASHPTAGVIYEGALVEREIETNIFSQANATLSLKEANFQNAISIQNLLNELYSMQVAVAKDSRSIELKKPQNKTMIEFIAEIQNLEMKFETKERIVINERTGTIVSGVGITVKPIVMTHGGITIKVLEQDAPSKPAGSMSVDEDMVIGVNENEIYTKKGTTTVANLVRSLQKLGASPKDIISILEAMKSAGSISADLKLI